jgi:NAD(P)-dependent dehydrogenase (short-subunit alcohol dehydrogenase family)
MNRVVLVTGGNTGIGAAIVRAFSEKGYSVIIHYYELEEEAEKLVCSSKEKCVMVKGDITAKSTHDALLAAVKKMGRLDVLVNNAGINPRKDFFTAEPSDFTAAFSVNVIAPLQLMQAFAPLLKKSKGSVVNITSIRGERPRTANVAYGASKAALINLTKAAAKALGPEVRVNCISPGPVRTRMQITDLAKKETVLARLAEPEEIASLVLSVAENTFMTGSNVFIDGGALL